ncbi:MAG TPA: metal-sensitive transcriptional regulator [bacterium (Candidatus Stahlbacteria)]|nr:metal-sensitive transcriptional regulator [Candidatus Stahlbacteria bacterium]
MTKETGCITNECKCNLFPRIKRIIGQLEGVERMIQEERYCVDILQQISSIHEALRGLGKEIMRNYLEQCATKAILSRNKQKQKEIYDEVMDVVYKYTK